MHLSAWDDSSDANERNDCCHRNTKQTTICGSPDVMPQQRLLCSLDIWVEVQEAKTAACVRDMRFPTVHSTLQSIMVSQQDL